MFVLFCVGGLKDKMSLFACLIQVYDMYRCTLAVMYSSMYGLMYCIDTYVLGNWLQFSN